MEVTEAGLAQMLTAVLPEDVPSPVELRGRARWSLCDLLAVGIVVVGCDIDVAGERVA